MNNEDIRTLSDDELWKATERLAGDARAAACDLIEALAELDRRRLLEQSAYASLHAYCVHKLLMSDASAYRYIRAARALAGFPPIGPALRDGRLSVEAIAILHPYLKDPDASELVASALGKSVSEIEALVSPRRTEEPRKDLIRLIASAPAAPRPAAAEPEPLILPAIPEPAPVTDGRRYESRADIYASIPAALPPPASARHDARIAFTADESFVQLLREVQAALRHKYPDGRLEGIFRDALKALLNKNRPWAIPKRPARAA